MLFVVQAREAAQEAMAHQLAMEKVRRELQTRDMEDLRLKEEQLKLELEHKQVCIDIQLVQETDLDTR